MKSQLIKSCGTGLLLCVVAGLAQAADKPRVSLGGYFTQSLNLVDIDTSSDETLEEEVLAQNAEIYFNAKTRLDNGTALGIRVELEAYQAGDQIDEHYLYMQGDWGKLIVGAENGVGHLMQVRAPSFVPGLKMYDNSTTDEGIEKAYATIFGSNVIEDAHMSIKLENISNDANKVSYMSPKVGGLQVAASFAPNNENAGGGENNTGAVLEDGQQEDIIELAVTFSGQAGGIKYQFGYSEVEGDSVSSDPDPESTSLGLLLASGSWSFGGNLSEYNDLGSVGDKYEDSEQIETLNYGFRYDRGRHYIGLGWTESEENKVSGTGVTTEYEEFMVGGGTKLADGVSIGYYYSENEVQQPQATDSANRNAAISTLGMLIDLRF